MSEGLARWQHEFVERMGALGDTTGLPPSFTQVFAWLVVCDPPQQSVEELRAALGLSAGAISAATATLVRLGLVERVSQAGQRRLAYRLRPQAWQRLLRMRLDATREICATADDALAHVPGPHDRLREMRDVLGYFEATLVALLDAPADGAGRREPSRTRRT